MRTLFISHMVPYPLNGGLQQRVYHLLRALSRISEVTFACPALGAKGTAGVGALQPLCREIFHYPGRIDAPRWRNPALIWAEWKLRNLHPLRPVDMQFARSRAGANLIRQLRPELYDLVWVERLRMMRILPSQMTTRVVVGLDDV